MLHSVYIDKSKCRGCTRCLKNCPTEAIRVVRSRAVIHSDRCIDCGQCVNICPYHAIGVQADTLEAQKNYKYNVALVDTVLYGQFENLTDPNIVLNGLLKIGFDDVFEVGVAAEILSLYYQKPDAKIWSGVYPRLSTDCPATVNLVRLEYPELEENLVPAAQPFELAAILARREAVEKTGLDPKDIGIGYISPCAARITFALHPGGLPEPVVDYALRMRDVYVQLLGPMKALGELKPLSRVGQLGCTWARSGGQSANLAPRNSLSVDDADNVLAVLDYLEDGKLANADYVEAAPCVQGCFGGCLTVDNPFNAKLKMRYLIDTLPPVNNEIPQDLEELFPWEPPAPISIDRPVDFAAALRREAEAVAVQRTLPGFDCGSCGAPSCKALAGDVADGLAPVDDCIYNIIRKMRGGNMDHTTEEDEFVPPTFRKPLEDDKEATS